MRQFGVHFTEMEIRMMESSITEREKYLNKLGGSSRDTIIDISTFNKIDEFIGKHHYERLYSIKDNITEVIKDMKNCYDIIVKDRQYVKDILKNYEEVFSSYRGNISKRYENIYVDNFIKDIEKKYVDYMAYLRYKEKYIKTSEKKEESISSEEEKDDNITITISKYELICPITLNRMKDPVIASDGIRYEREAIEKVLSSSGNSPITREKLDDKLISCHFTKSIIDKMSNI